MKPTEHTEVNPSQSQERKISSHLNQVEDFLPSEEGSLPEDGTDSIDDFLPKEPVLPIPPDPNIYPREHMEYAIGVIAAWVEVLSDRPEELLLSLVKGHRTWVMELTSTQEGALKQIIGKDGASVEALRMLMTVAERRTSNRAIIRILDPQQWEYHLQHSIVADHFKEIPPKPNVQSWVKHAMDLVHLTIMMLIDAPSSVSVGVNSGKFSRIFEVSCDPEDVRLVIGKGGSKIEAIRLLLTRLGVRQGEVWTIEVDDPQRSPPYHGPTVVRRSVKRRRQSEPTLLGTTSEYKATAA